MNQSRLLRATFSAALLRTSRTWRRRVDDALRGLPVSEATGFALLTIHRLGDGVRQNTVADAIGIEGPSFVRLLDQLCAAGLVERREDKDDRRAKTLHLTQAGLALATEVDTHLHGIRAEILGDVPDSDLEACLRVFRAIESADSRLATAGGRVTP